MFNTRTHFLFCIVTSAFQAQIQVLADFNPFWRVLRRLYVVPYFHSSVAACIPWLMALSLPAPVAVWGAGVLTLHYPALYSLILKNSQDSINRSR